MMLTMVKNGKGELSSQVVEVPVLELGALHAVHVVLHRELVLHRTRRAVASLDLVDAAEAVAHQTKDPLVVVFGALRVGRARRALALVGVRPDLPHLVLCANVLEFPHFLVEIIHRTTSLRASVSGYINII